jgi:amino acid transporter
MNIEDKNGTVVLRRTKEDDPPRSWRDLVIGRPLATADAPHQTLRKIVALAVFASDALSSTAYATQEMMAILAAAGTIAFGYVFPLAMVITGLLFVVTVSYEQTIHAYPNGGGSYIVSRDNLGALPAKVAAAAILTDYILTVAVSISSGVAQIVSAFPAVFDYRVYLAVGLVIFIMMINLRGMRESGIIFAIPTYFFLFIMYINVLVGMTRYFLGPLGIFGLEPLGVVVDPPPVELAIEPVAGVTLFLLLRAFSSGSAALTGVEAISDGIPAFREPRSRNAGITLIWMSTILASLLLGISFLAAHIQAVPSVEETIISQLARTAFNGRGLMYLLTITATTVILVMAANTSFADFPRLSAITANDGLLPRQLTYRGSRLAYSRGIMVLAVLSSLLIVVFQASVTRLIPLYAIGVFMSFTLSQSGMARRWWKIGHLAPNEEVQERGSKLIYDDGWKGKLAINGFGAILTAFVVVLFAVTKFKDGAYVILILIPALVILFSVINRHYSDLATRLSLENYGAPPHVVRNRIILPLGGVHRGTLAALRYAHTLSDDITAVHVSIDSEETRRIQEKWEIWGQGVRLVIIESQYRRFLEPLLLYIDEIYQKRQPHEVITIVVPQFVPRRRWSNLLHTNTAATLRKVLMFRHGIVITNVPYLVD